MMSSDLIVDVQEALGRRPHESITPSGGDRQAAVTLLLRKGEEEPAILFVRRGEWVNDPWSGHTALPGGHVASGDADPLDAARRELEEEVGLALARDDYIGRLDDLRPSARSPSVVVTPFVASVDAPVELRSGDEIQSYRWIPIEALRDPAYRSELSHMSRGLKLMFPSIVYRGFTIWGLTHSVISNFLEVAADL